MNAQTYTERQNVGRCKYVVTYYTGNRLNPDGSIAADVQIFTSKRAASVFVKSLELSGYSRA